MHECAEDNFWDEYLRVGKDLDIRRFPYLYLDRQPCNRSLYSCVVGALSGRLGISKDAVKQRLIEMGLLIVEDNACGNWDNAGAVSVGEIMRRIFS